VSLGQAAHAGPSAAGARGDLDEELIPDGAEETLVIRGGRSGVRNDR